MHGHKGKIRHQGGSWLSKAASGYLRWDIISWNIADNFVEIASRILVDWMHNYRKWSRSCIITNTEIGFIASCIRHMMINTISINGHWIYRRSTCMFTIIQVEDTTYRFSFRSKALQNNKASNRTAETYPVYRADNYSKIQNTLIITADKQWSL